MNQDGSQKQGGSIAASSGSTLESMVIGAIANKGLEVIMYRHWEKNKEQYGNELLLRHVPYTTIYGHNGNTEFLIMSEQRNISTRIECKWQQTNGSVDEKFPYLFANCVEQLQESHIIILLDGGGAKPGAVEWLNQVCLKYNNDPSANKIIEVMDVMKFTCWVNQTFK